MHPTLAELLLTAPVVTDGAWGTELQKRGLPVGELPDRWNLEQPDKVADVATAYVAAGSQVILTNTFGANRIRLREYGLEHRTREINRAGAEISLRAAASSAKVFASLGPTGKMVFAGEVSPEEVISAYREQAEALAEAGVHGLVIETMADLQEAQLALAGVKPVGLPVVVCFTFDTGPESDRTMMGVTPEQAAQVMAECEADAIGANCGTGIEKVRAVCIRYKAASNLPIWIKPNAGLPQLRGDRTVYESAPEKFAELAAAVVDAGAAFIGGCCGTTPEHINALVRRLKNTHRAS